MYSDLTQLCVAVWDFIAKYPPCYKIRKSLTNEGVSKRELRQQKEKERPKNALILGN